MITRLLYRVYRRAARTAAWIRRRFTRMGVVALVTLVFAAGMGVDIQQAMAYQLFAVLAGFFLIAIIGSLAFRGRFTIQRALPRFGTVGEPLTYRVTVGNVTDQVQAGLRLLDSVEERPVTLDEFRRLLRPSRVAGSPGLPASRALLAPAKLQEQPLPSLPPRGEGSVQVELLPLRRGPLRLTSAAVVCPDPLGLYRRLFVVPLPQSMVILPRRYLLPRIALPGSMQYQQGGVALASSVGRSDEFVSLREYRRGDPLRHIHWRSWARVGKPVVKEFQDEFFVRHALILDTFGRPDDEEVFEEAVSVAASFACTIETQESLLDLLFVGPRAFCFTTGRGLAHTDQILEVLASVQPCAEKSFQTLRNLVLEHARLVSGCVCVFLAWDESRRELVRQLRAIGLPLLVLVIVSSGESTEVDPGPMQELAGDFHVVPAGRVAEALANL